VEHVDALLGFDDLAIDLEGGMVQNAVMGGARHLGSHSGLGKSNSM